jgi:hypothetical protein
MSAEAKKPPGFGDGRLSNAFFAVAAIAHQIADPFLEIKKFLAALDPAALVALGALVFGEAR